jgi:hypothetical protein
VYPGFNPFSTNLVEEITRIGESKLKLIAISYAPPFHDLSKTSQPV